MTEQGTEEIVDAEVVEETEVAQLPPTPEMLTARMDELREQIGQITNVINSNQKQLDTYVAAFNWYSQQLEAASSGQQYWILFLI